MPRGRLRQRCSPQAICTNQKKLERQKRLASSELNLYDFYDETGYCYQQHHLNTHYRQSGETFVPDVIPSLTLMTLSNATTRGSTDCSAKDRADGTAGTSSIGERRETSIRWGLLRKLIR